MKEWLSRKLEAQNQKNTEYYKRAFRLNAQENISIFNYTACFFPALWLVYRKMYMFAVLWQIASIFFQSFGLQIIVMIGMVVFGRFGNRWYFREIRFRIAKGYLKMEDYNPISPLSCAILICFDLLAILCLLYFAVDFILLYPNDFASDSFSMPRFLLKSVYIGSIVLLVLIFWAIDYKKFHSRETNVSTGVDSLEMSEESVNQYLDKSDPKEIPMALLIFSAVYGLAFAATLYKVTHLDQTSMEKFWKAAAVLDSKNPLGSKLRPGGTETNQLRNFSNIPIR